MSKLILTKRKDNRIWLDKIDAPIKGYRKRLRRKQFTGRGLGFEKIVLDNIN